MFSNNLLTQLSTQLSTQINNYNIYIKIVIIIVLLYIIYNLNIKVNKKNKKLCLIIPVYEINNKYIKNIYENLKNKGYNFKINLLKYKSLKEMEKSNLGHDINLAILLNNDCDYYCIQDNYIIPTKLNDYNYTNYPRYTSMIIKKENNNSKIVGGSFIINKQTLIQTNGFINNSKEPLEDIKNILNKGFIRYLNCDINNRCEINMKTKEILFNNKLKKEEHIQNIRNSINTCIIDEYNIKHSLNNLKNDIIIYIYNILNYILKLLGSVSKLKNIDYLKDIKNINNTEYYLHNNGLDQIDLENINDKVHKYTSINVKDLNLENLYIINIQ